MLRGDAGDASTSAPHRSDPRPPPTGWRGYVARVPKGEAVMLAATFTFAFQNVVAKTVEKGVPPMQVVFVRSCISGCVTAFTTWRRAAECNAIVREADAETTGGETLPASASSGEDLRDWHVHDRDPPGPSAVLAPVPPARRRGKHRVLARVRLAHLPHRGGQRGDILPEPHLQLAHGHTGARGEAESRSGCRHRRRARRHPAHRQAPPALFHALGAPLNDDDRHPRSTDGSGGGGGDVIFRVFLRGGDGFDSSGEGSGQRAALAVWFHGCSAVLGFVSVTSAWPLPPVWPTAHEWGLLILISLTSFVGQLSLNYGYSHLPTLTASALYYLMVAWSALLGWAMMGERVDAYGALGAVAICVGGLAPGVHKARVERAARGRSGR